MWLLQNALNTQLKNGINTSLYYFVVLGRGLAIGAKLLFNQSRDGAKQIKEGKTPTFLNRTKTWIKKTQTETRMICINYCPSLDHLRHSITFARVVVSLQLRTTHTHVCACAYTRQLPYTKILYVFDENKSIDDLSVHSSCSIEAPTALSLPSYYNISADFNECKLW
jgi:hypothetical protein